MSIINRNLNYEMLSKNISNWIYNYAKSNFIDSLVVGVSGGIDSAVVSTLCARTGLPVYALGMPIHQNDEQETLSNLHLGWLQNNYFNVTALKIDLSDTFDLFKSSMPEGFNSDNLSLANSRSRLRMIALYQVAGSKNGIVVGTGNKVEDYGVGFYTKYGDGGVDIAPIADLYKSEVYNLGKYLNVIDGIINAKPTDGLWDDGRTDEDQLGTTYDILEYIMENNETVPEKYKKDLNIYKKFNRRNSHKMNPIPTFRVKEYM